MLEELEELEKEEQEIRMEKYGITEKGVVLCEVWKLQTTTIFLGIINIIFEIILLSILLLM